MKKGPNGALFHLTDVSGESRTPDKQAQFEPRPTQSAETTVPRSGAGHLSGRARENRIAFAFDPRRRAVLLVGGDKSGASEKRFYTRLVKVADERYDVHLTRVKSQTKR